MPLGKVDVDKKTAAGDARKARLSRIHGIKLMLVEDGYSADDLIADTHASHARAARKRREWCS